MKCLSLKQPFAELVVLGWKTVELRTWNTKFKGQFLVHASQKLDKQVCQLYNIDPGSLARGAIIGKATVYCVKKYRNKKEFEADRKRHLAPVKYADHKYAFMLKNPVKFPEPIFMKGKLGFYNVDLDI